MTKVVSALILLSILYGLILFAQAPTGLVTGTVTDESGGVMANVAISITNKATGIARAAITGTDGSFSAPALPAGEYEVRAEAKGFRTLQRDATVQAGGSTTVNMPMTVGEAKSLVTVEAATAQIEYDKNAIDGVVSRATIEGLPLNGRSYMQLASIEPGVKINTSGTSQYNSQFSVSVLGGDSGRTAISVDGGPVRDTIEGSGSSMNFSQEVVQ